jgi:hypothetical protein
MEIAYYLPGVTPREDLITSSSLVTKKEFVFHREFQQPACTISLRPFCITRDMAAISQWDPKLGRAGDMMAASYLYTGDSDFARSFMVLVNGRTPVCQIDISQAAKDELYESYQATPGDYIIRLLFNTTKKKVRSLHVRALQACMEYFFSFPELIRLIAETDKGNALQRELLLKAGFCFKEKISHQYSVSGLYQFARPSFHKNLFQ